MNHRLHRACFAAFAALALFAPQIAVADSNVVGKVEFLISQHGALADGRTINTKAIQSAIDDCAKAGGGTVVVTKGVFVTGSIFLKPGVNLRVEQDAVLKGSSNTNDYPWLPTRIAGLEMKWPAALVNADGLTNVSLTGAGTIDGSGARWWKEYWAVRAAETNSIDPHFKVARPRLVQFLNSSKVLVAGLTLKDSAFWNLQLTYCDGVEVRDVKVRVPGGDVKAASSDGIDVDSTRNVVISGCDIECDDDAICLKSGRDADGLRVNRPTENVLIKNCRVTRGAGLVVIGSETSGGIRHVRVTDCIAGKDCGEVVRFKTRMDRGGIVEDVIYENIQSDGAKQVFSFNMDAFSKMWIPEEFRTPVPADKGTPIFRNITVRNLTAKNCAAAGHIVGLAQSPIINVKLENVVIEHTEKALVVKNTRGLQCEKVSVNGQPYHAPAEQQLGMAR
ncbi:MAG: hypothetical protein RLZZ350_2039 [Verrucomicrobiota bacterium]|jgi:polygalacturonase